MLTTQLTNVQPPTIVLSFLLMEPHPFPCLCYTLYEKRSIWSICLSTYINFREMLLHCQSPPPPPLGIVMLVLHRIVSLEGRTSLLKSNIQSPFFYLLPHTMEWYLIFTSHLTGKLSVFYLILPMLSQYPCCVKPIEVDNNKREMLTDFVLCLYFITNKHLHTATRIPRETL